jgi:hypothetical protein
MCSGFLGCVDHWQTLIGGFIGGFLVLVAGVATVWVTRNSANRQIKATKDAARGQIAAAQDQTKAAEHETSVLRDIEDRRLASEKLAFYSILEVATECIIDDVKAAEEIELPRNPGQSAPVYQSPQAYDKRRRIRRTGFVELRSGLLRFGGPLTTPFLRLDGDIENFAAQFDTEPGGTRYVGLHAGLPEQLKSIEEQATALRDKATALRDKAAIEMKRCDDRLSGQGE